MAEAEKTVTKAAFIAALKKKQASLVKGAKTQRQVGFMDDAGILMKLGIGEGERKTFPGNLSKIVFSFAKGDPNRPSFRFSYAIKSSDPRANGTIVQNSIIVEEAAKADGTVWRTEEQASAELFGYFQGLGEDTTTWKNPLEDAVNAAEEHTKAKTPIMITVSAFKRGNGELGMNVTTNPANDGSDIEDTEAEQDDSDTTSEQGEFDGNQWIGVWIEFEYPEVGPVRMRVDSYDAESNSFSGTDENNEEWSGDYAISIADIEFTESENQD